MKSTKKLSVVIDGRPYAQHHFWKEKSFDNYRNYQKNFKRNHYKQIVIHFNKDNELNLYDKVCKQDNATEYIRELIRKDMQRNGQEI
jgi:hypothetical protein